MRFLRYRRLRLILVLSVLALGGAGTTVLFVQHVSQPHPERFATGVVSGGPTLEDALASPVARRYLRDFRTQETLSSCGPSSVLNVLASLDASIPDESALFEGNQWQRLRMRTRGMNLDDVATLVAEQKIGRVTVLRDLPYEGFLAALLRCNDLANRCIVNFDRGPIFGVSVGHFSPIAGYDPRPGLVTLLDVTPGFGPTLIPSELLYAAVQTKDSETGRTRGLLLLSETPRAQKLPQMKRRRRHTPVDSTVLRRAVPGPRSGIGVHPCSRGCRSRSIPTRPLRHRLVRAADVSSRRGGRALTTLSGRCRCVRKRPLPIGLRTVEFTRPDL